MKLRQAFRIFFNSQKATGVILILCTIFSIAAANSPWSEGYCHFWEARLLNLPAEFHLPVSPLDITNDLLMAVFFLLVGLEIKREVLSGELSSFQRASLPVAAAIGGMIVPALFYLVFNHGRSTESGWGIPMATDIAFAIGILSLLGNRVPDSLKLLLTALAVADDLGAVLVIALFYSSGLSLLALSAAAVTLLILYIFNRRGVRSLWAYGTVGLLLWYFIHLSGIHATVAGVLLAMMIPYDARTASDPLQRLEQLLHLPVGRVILPLFALVNTALVLDSDPISALTSFAGTGIIVGLVLGKPLGILSTVYLSVKTGVSRLPEDLNYRLLLGAGLLGGIGFTMSIFIALLAFSDPSFTEPAKVAILSASAVAGLCGYIYLDRVLPRG